MCWLKKRMMVRRQHADQPRNDGDLSQAVLWNRSSVRKVERNTVVYILHAATERLPVIVNGYKGNINQRKRKKQIQY